MLSPLAGISKLPPIVQAAGAVLLLLIGLAVFRAIWWLVESPMVRHFLHANNPECWRCIRDFRMREEKRRHQQIIREIRERRRA